MTEGIVDMLYLFHFLGSWTRIVLSVFSATIIVKLWHDQHIVRRKRAELLRQYDCKLPSARPHKDPFGLEDMYEATQAAKSKTWLERQRAQYEEFGNTFSSRFLTTTVINTIEPENIKTVLQTKFQDYGIGERRKKAFAPLLGKAIIQVDGIEWRHSRTRIRKILTTHQVHDVSVFERHVAALIDVIPKDGSTVDLKDLFFRLSADITTDLFFGESTLSLHDRSARNVDFIHAVHAAQSGCQDRWQLGNLAVLMPQRDFRKHVGIVFAYVDKYVERALEYRRVFLDEIQSPADTRSVRPDFLKELAKTTGDRQVLKDEILALFFAGSDTTAAALTDLFFEVSRKPSVWQKLREEVETVVHGTPTAQDLRKTPYVEKCIKEALRLHPVAPSNSRMAYKDTVLPVGGGPNQKAPVIVTAGTMVSYSVGALHRRKDIWGADADCFRPERWDNTTASWGFLPFNGGPRVCLGQELAMNELSYVLIRLVQSYSKIASKDTEPWIEGLALACSSYNGAKVALTADVI